MTILQMNKNALDQASSLLAAGELVSFPTETVYGLGADATNDTAVKKIYAAKGRPSFNPLIVHVCDHEMAARVGVLNERAQKLIAAFWPGPLALVLNKSQVEDCYSIAPTVTAGLDTIAVRMPDIKEIREMIARAGVPIAAPSANKSGHTSPTSAIHVVKSLGEQAPQIILAGGACQVGLESTILDVSGDVPRILRPGAVTQAQIEAIIGAVDIGIVVNDKTPNAPGQLTKHYATQKPLRMNAVDVKEGEALLAFGSVKYIGAQGYGFAKDMPPSLYKNLSSEGDLTEAAMHLFDYMHALDHSHATGIAVMPIPQEGIGVAINDRLTRAALK